MSPFSFDSTVRPAEPVVLELHGVRAQAVKKKRGKKKRGSVSAAVAGHGAVPAAAQPQALQAVSKLEPSCGAGLRVLGEAVVQTAVVPVAAMNPNSQDTVAFPPLHPAVVH